MSKKQKYQEYLQSEEWDRLRRLAYKRANNLCELCGEKADAVHHIQYPKSLQGDELKNLLVVCASCHNKLHGIRPKNFEICTLEDFFTHEFFDDIDDLCNPKNQELCPVCYEEWNHLSGTYLNIGGQVFVVTDEGVNELFKNVKPTGRGVSLWVQFLCEHGHSWFYRWQFHKGVTYRTTYVNVDIDPMESEQVVIWRN